VILLLLSLSTRAAEPPQPFFQKHCAECHDTQTAKGDLDLTSLKFDPSNPENFARWLKIYDRIDTGEMPPKKKPRPAADEPGCMMR